MNENKEFTGYPSIDKPWLKYYSEEALNAKLPECTMYEYLYENNKEYLHNNALDYFGNKITYGELFGNIEKATKAFQAIGIVKGDVVTIMSMHTPEIVYCVYALNRLGAVANMVYMTLSEKELLHEINNTDSKALVVLNLAFSKVEKIYSELAVKNIIVVSPADSMKVPLKIGYKLKTKQPKLRKNYLSYDGFVKLGKAEYKIKDLEINGLAIIAHTRPTMNSQ